MKISEGWVSNPLFVRITKEWYKFRGQNLVLKNTLSYSLRACRHIARHTFIAFLTIP